MQVRRYVMAVDGGGTKTAAALYGSAGELLASAATGPCNLYQDRPGGLAAIAAAWQAVCATADLRPDEIRHLAALSLGLAGIKAPGAAAACVRSFEGFARLHLSSDGYTALIGATRGGPGALLVAGTGVVGHRLQPDGQCIALGGWGFPLGDRGGGAWLGFRLVGDWLEATEGGPGGPGDTPLWAIAMRHVGSGQATILGWLGRARPADFAALAPAVVAAAEAGDPYAAGLVAEAGSHILRLATALEPTPEAPLYLAGGLARVFAPGLVAELGEASVAGERLADPLEGARLIAQGVAPAEITTDQREAER